jgi:hypothetical protein
MRSARGAALILGLLVVGVTVAAAGSDQKFIEAAKRTSARRLDARLPRISVSRWLDGLAAPGTLVAWEVNDCGEATGSPADTARDLPVCAEADLSLRDGRRVSLAMDAGTMRRGVVPPAGFFWATVRQSDSTVSFGSFDKLVTYLKRNP